MEMNFLYGIQNFLQIINDNWVVIITIIGLIIAIVKKAKDYFAKSNEEKIAVAKKQIKETMLRLVTDAECQWSEWVSAGQIKRSQVIEEIFTLYPILTKVTDQEALIAWIDDVIDMSLDTMREIFESQTENVE